MPTAHSGACLACPQVDAFAPEYWGGPLYHDADKALYRVFGGGAVRTASALAMLNPFHPAWARIRAAK